MEGRFDGERKQKDRPNGGLEPYANCFLLVDAGGGGKAGGLRGRDVRFGSGEA